MHGEVDLAQASVMSSLLLAWWDDHGRSGIPWKTLPNGERPAPDQTLTPTASGLLR